MRVFTRDQDIETLKKAWKEKNFRLCTSWKQLFLYQQLALATDPLTVIEIGRLAKRKLEKLESPEPKKLLESSSIIAEEVGLV